MKKDKSNLIKLKNNHPLIGTWYPIDNFSDVKIIISRNGNKFHVKAIDTYDDEEAEIYDVNWDDDKNKLFFNTYWSTGRFTKYCFFLQSENKVSVTFTYTTQEIWERDS